MERLRVLVRDPREDSGRVEPVGQRPTSLDKRASVDEAVPEYFEFLMDHWVRCGYHETHKDQCSLCAEFIPIRDALLKIWR
jgi:hypothetical protein